MDYKHRSMEELILEQMIELRPQAILTIFIAVCNWAMKIERERFIGAQHYERSEGHRAYANGYRPKRIDTLAGIATLSALKTACQGDTPFYPNALDRGRRYD